jgi:hypothetical protein
MLRPISASAVLRQCSPRKIIGSAYHNHGRLNSVRDDSPHRLRSNSIKRKSDESMSYAGVATKGLVPVRNDEETRKKLDGISLEIGKVGSLCEKMSDGIAKVDNPVLAEVLTDMKNAIQGISKVQEVFLKEKLDGLAPVAEVNPASNSGTGTGMVSLGNVAKKNSGRQHR